MSLATSITLPKEIIEKATEISKEEGIDVEEFISRAVTEKVAAREQFKSLKERADRASREKFLRALSKVPNIEPEEHDRF